MKAKLIFASLFLSMAGLSAQTYQVPVSEQDEPMMKGKFEPTSRCVSARRARCWALPQA